MSDIAFYGTMSKKDSKILTGELAGKNGGDIKNFILAAGKKFRGDNLKNDSKIDNALEDGFDMFNREWNLSFNVDFLIDKWEWYVDEDYSFKIHEITLFWDTKKNWKVFVKELANKVAVDYNKGDKVIGFNKKGLTKAITYARKQHFTWGSINIKASSLNNSKEKFIKFQLEFEYKGKRYNEEVEVLVYYWTVDDFVNIFIRVLKILKTH